MINESKVTLKEKSDETGTGAKRGRRSERPKTRISLEDMQSKLQDVGGKDPDYHYHWAFDNSEEGARIHKLRNLGYEFADAREHEVPLVDTFDTTGGDTIIRRANGKAGGYMYLMRQPNEYREEDLAYKKKKAQAAVQGIHKPASLEGDMDGVYGKIKIDN